MLTPFSSSNHFIAALILIISFGVMVGCQGNSGPPRFEVTGIVAVDGTPAAGMLVQLQRQDAGTGNDQYPSCISDSNGKFQFGGNSTTPGLIEGSYVATFAWLEGKDLETKDKLQGKFSEASKSSFRLKVPGDGLTDVKFELKQPK